MNNNGNPDNNNNASNQNGVALGSSIEAVTRETAKQELKRLKRSLRPSRKRKFCIDIVQTDASCMVTAVNGCYFMSGNYAAKQWIDPKTVPCNACIRIIF